MEVDLHLPALRQDVDRRVLVDREVHAVGRGRRTELVDLFLERRDLLTRFVQRVHQLLVLVERRKSGRSTSPSWRSPTTGFCADSRMSKSIMVPAEVMRHPFR